MKKQAIIFYLCLLTCLTNLDAQQSTFTNPIISGAYPDPSICRVGEDYYMCNSSFEYFPGLPIWHSKDLVHWENIGFGINRPEQLNYDGLASSSGIWAGTIRMNKGIYYLPFTWTDYRMKVGFKNVMITATNPAGPWSDPYIVTDSIWGIDPALFFDDDGKAYWLMNHPPVGFSHLGATSIMIQEINLSTMTLQGQPAFIGRGAMIDAQYPEGPKLYKKDGYYYLLISEGGTGPYHAITISRSRNIVGPYENYQGNPILTHRMMGNTTPINNVGHADIVQTPAGDWWMVCLATRPLAGTDNILGRETFLVPMVWEKDQWPIVSPGFGLVKTVENLPNLPAVTFKQIPAKDEFDNAELSNLWTHLRTPAKNSYSLSGKKGYLKLQLLPAVLFKMESPAFIGQRLRYRSGEISAKMDFQATNKNEEAGLVLYKSEKAFIKFVLTKVGKVRYLDIISNKDSLQTTIFHTPLTSKSALELRIIQQENKFSFHYKTENSAWIVALQNFDGHILSVESADGYMGAFIALYASSNSVKSTNFALFDWFEYKETK